MQKFTGISGIRYRFHPKADLIHQGRFSRAYRARGDDGRDYFLKWLNQAFHPNELSLPVQHPQWIRCCDVVRAGAQDLILVFPFRTGLPLAVAQKDIRKDENRFRQLVFGILSALEPLHEAGWYHGDLKPSNLLCATDSDKSVQVELIDFGKAMPWFALPDSDFSFSMIYAPPEIILRRYQLVGPASDLYSLALILLEVITGRKPFHSSHPEMLVQMMINRDPDLPEGKSDTLSAFFRKALHKPKFSLPPQRLDPVAVEESLASAIAQRFQSVSDFRSAFDAINWSPCFRKKKWMSWF